MTFSWSQKILLLLTLIALVPILSAIVSTRRRGAPLSSKLFHLLMLPMFLNVAGVWFSYDRQYADTDTEKITAVSPFAPSVVVAEAQRPMYIACFVVALFCGLALLVLRRNPSGIAGMQLSFFGLVAVVAAELLVGARVVGGADLRIPIWIGFGVSVICVLWTAIALIRKREVEISRFAIVGLMIFSAIAGVGIWRFNAMLTRAILGG